MLNFFPYKTPIDTHKAVLDGIRGRIESGELVVDTTGQEKALPVMVDKLAELLRTYDGSELEEHFRKTIHTYEKQILGGNRAGLPESAYLWTITDGLRKKYFERFPEGRVE